MSTEVHITQAIPATSDKITMSIVLESSIDCGTTGNVETLVNAKTTRKNI